MQKGLKVRKIKQERERRKETRRESRKEKEKGGKRPDKQKTAYEIVM